jgi:hypothetical protein
MLRRTYGALLLAAALIASGCSDPPPPITVEEGMVTVHNQTPHDWTNVLITVNDHFRGFVKELKAEGRMNAPVSQMTTGHGQRWAHGTGVRKVQVKAEQSDGTPVELTWDASTQRRRN